MTETVLESFGPQTKLSQEIHATKYRGVGESFYDAMCRISAALADDEDHRKHIKNLLLQQKFLPGGRIQASIGSPKKTTANNCLSGETEILTKEYGAIKIKDVAKQVVTLLDGNNNWIPCPILDHGIQETYELTFKGGFQTTTQRSTLNHDWVHNNTNTKIKTKALFKLKRVEINDLRPTKTIKNEDQYKKGIIHGIFYGDGTIANGVYAIRICSKHEDTEKWLKEYPHTNSPSNNGDPTYYISFTKAWTNLKELPITANISSDYLLGFFRGWFLADGCVSLQPCATLCCGAEEKNWIKQWGPLVGWHSMSQTMLADQTNFGVRKKKVGNLHFKLNTLTQEDFLSTKHKDRWKTRIEKPLRWRIYGPPKNKQMETVYCPIVPTTHSFALANGIHSGNCFVSGKIDDSMLSIMDMATKAALTMRMGGGIGYDFCVSPDTKILTSNLDWVKAEDLTIGQELVGFSENLNLQKNKFKPAFVESNKSLIAEIIDVLTDKNSTKVSADHLFVVLRKKDFPHKKKGKGYKWVKARDLKEGDKIAFISKPWDIDEWKTYDAGWFAGMMDGEGWCVSQTTKTGGSKTHSGLAQNVGKVNDKILELLTKYEIPNKSYRYTNPNAIFESHRFRGTWAAARLIGICKPIRFNPKKIWEGAKLSTRSNPSATVITTKSLGAGKVFAVKTSTKTLIADGFLGHNSNLRPKGANIVTLESPASGPISFMKIYDAVCATVKSAGSRRGAQMGILNCNHPDIEEFVRAKQNTDQLTNFNISIGVYDDFMKAVFENKTYDLIFNDQIYKTIDAKALWEEIMRSTWDWAEPGVLFLDKINEYNNLWYCEDIHATNPCGEVPLPPFGTCLLGSVNLVKYITPNKVFDWDTFIADIPAIVRALDNVIDRTIYPLKEYEREQKNKRRMGIGITGLANAGEALGYPYATDKFLEFTKRVMKTLRNECYLASIDLAKEKGSFPLFDKDKFVESKFIKRLPKQIQEAIYEHGIRNSHLLSVAPTGTISLSADNVSSGIEPVFAHEYSRTIITEDGPVVEPVKDYGVNVFGVKGRTTDDISALEHLNVLTTVQYYVDQACSKTINVGDNVSWEDFKEIYKKAWQNGAKGVTTFRASGKRMGILNKTEKQPVTACLNGACEI